MTRWERGLTGNDAYWSFDGLVLYTLSKENNCRARGEITRKERRDNVVNTSWCSKKIKTELRMAGRTSRACEANVLLEIVDPE